jgi:hypothetical protein
VFINTISKLSDSSAALSPHIITKHQQHTSLPYITTHYHHVSSPIINILTCCSCPVTGVALDLPCPLSLFLGVVFVYNNVNCLTILVTIHRLQNIPVNQTLSLQLSLPPLGLSLLSYSFSSWCFKQYQSTQEQMSTTYLLIILIICSCFFRFLLFFLHKQ